MQRYILFILFISLIYPRSADWDADTVHTSLLSYKVELFSDGYVIPWGMSFLPDGDLLVSDISGNSATATALANARTIAGVSFDGTANISIASTNLSDTSSIALLTSSQTLTNKTLTSPVINTGISGTAILDEDDMSSNSATQLATQQSIKAFVDAVESRTRAFAIAIGAGL